ncbi:MAG: STAS/SEC14 domain-containing protein [Gammaproteobacteria bacterium]|nr:STAS/SEC14 domain-containing protein [Gammaproteobacteria bacterium]
MPAIHTIDNEIRLLITIWEGVACDLDFIKAIKKYQNDIQNHPDYISYNEVVDFTKVTGVELSIEGIKNIGLIASTTDLNDVNRKLAIIVSSNLAYGLARMYEAYRSFEKKAHKEIRIFKNEKDAFEWVLK